MPPTPPRILVVRFSSIGDILLTTPLVRALRARHPDAFVAVLTKERFAALYRDNPRIDRLHTLGRHDSLAALAVRLRRERFTHLLDLHGSVRTRLLRALVPGRWSGYPKHRAARALLIRTKHDRYRDRRPVPERYFDAARRLDVAPDGCPPELFLHPEAIAGADAWLEAAGLPGPLVALAPGAAHATKRWPLDSWIALAGRLADAGRSMILVGGPEDREVAAAVAAAVPGRAAVAAGRFDLQGTGALLRRASASLSGDTGVMHLATAVGTPVIALFGPTVRAFGFSPYSERAVVLERDLACRPCSRMGGPACPLGHHRCLRDIGPHEVAAAVLGLP